MVSHIPQGFRQDGVFRQYMEKLYPDSVYDTFLCYNYARLQKLVNERDDLVEKLEDAVGTMIESGDRPSHRITVCGQTVDSIDYYSSHIQMLNERIVSEQNGVNSPSEIGFVAFKSIKDANEAMQMQHTIEPFVFEVTPAPAPSDIVWENIPVSSASMVVRKSIVFGLIVLLIAFYTVPVSLLSSLATATFQKAFPVLSTIPAAEGIISSFGLILIMAVLPTVVYALLRFTGIKTSSALDGAVFDVYFYLQIINFFLVSMISGTIFNVLADVLKKPERIFSLLAASLPNTAHTFLHYIMARAFVTFPLELLRLPDLFWGFIVRCMTKSPRKIRKAEGVMSFAYGSAYPMYLLVFIIGITYSVMTPLILPFTLAFFVIGLFVTRYQLMYILSPVYESGGNLFRKVYERLVIGVLIFQCTMIGYLGLKEGALQSTLLLPLLCITLLAYRFTKLSFDKPSRILSREEVMSGGLSLDLRESSFMINNDIRVQINATRTKLMSTANQMGDEEKISMISDPLLNHRSGDVTDYIHPCLKVEPESVERITNRQ